MKTCEVCGRPIRTGRKYCYEHRGTRSDNVVDYATKQYVSHHSMRSKTVLVCFGMLFFIIILMAISMKGAGYACFTIGLIAELVTMVFVLYIYKKRLKIKFSWEAERDVREKNPEYVNWVQNRVNKVKDEREFRKNLWR